MHMRAVRFECVVLLARNRKGGRFKCVVLLAHNRKGVRLKCVCSVACLNRIGVGNQVCGVAWVVDWLVALLAFCKQPPTGIICVVGC